MKKQITRLRKNAMYLQYERGMIIFSKDSVSERILNQITVHNIPTVELHFLRTVVLVLTA